MRHRPLVVAGLVAALSATAVLTATMAQADTTPVRLVAADPPTIPTSAPLVHIGDLQKIADANGGTRAHGRPGHKASVEAVKAKLDAVGFKTQVVPFNHAGAQGWNLIADWTGGDENNILMVGAHIDSVTAGPGLNDNGSGTSAILEVALQVAKANLKPTRHLRFAWWGAEEIGLIGSSAYVRALPAAEKSKIKSYLNFDMVATKKVKKWGVYSDGDKALAAEIKAWYDARNVPTVPLDINGRSDHAAFTRAGIAASGVISEDSLSNLDPCYHKACDTQTSLSPDALGLATNMIAGVMWKLSGAKVAARS
ncbi:aminopeptidase [Pilimelia terevasa]|uniref:Aminopeptidase n=1 Tax=Pilimelia terevasa TaxID=53372 RepID=A0A8J3BNQ5_9ACTN|nr:M28 family peptidase [Pilimelia terevasa]GGK22358.1 aminopeptidase [Pilimelia terevasa]